MSFTQRGLKMRELTDKEEKDLVKYCMEPKNTRLALAIGQVIPTLIGSHESHAEETMMSELTDEEKEFLIDYCMKPENARLALAIGQVIPTIERRILSSFLEKLDKSVKKEIESRDDLRWRPCIPKKDLEEEDLKEKFTILYVMTMENQEVEIHLGLFNWNSGPKERELYVGTHKKIEGRTIHWPNEKLADFLNHPDIKKDDSRHWRSFSTPIHRYINNVKSLSTLNDELKGGKIKYFTGELVCFAGKHFEKIGRVKMVSDMNLEQEIQRFFEGAKQGLDVLRPAVVELDLHLARKFDFFRFINLDENRMSDVFAYFFDPDETHGQKRPISWKIPGRRECGLVVGKQLVSCQHRSGGANHGEPQDRYRDSFPT